MQRRRAVQSNIKARVQHVRYGWCKAFAEQLQTVSHVRLPCTAQPAARTDRHPSVGPPNEVSTYRYSPHTQQGPQAFPALSPHTLLSTRAIPLLLPCPALPCPIHSLSCAVRNPHQSTSISPAPAATTAPGGFRSARHGRHMHAAATVERLDPHFHHSCEAYGGPERSRWCGVLHHVGPSVRVLYR